MFGSWAIIGDLETDDVTKERDPPKQAIPLSFPQFIPKPPPQGSIVPEKGYLKRLSDIRKPGDITSKHLESLGLEIFANASIRDLIPSESPDAQDCIPPLPPPNSYEQPTKILERDDPKAVHLTMSNGRPAPSLQDFETRVSELQIPNEEAWCVIQRKPPPEGKPRRKLACFRSFYEKLLLMAQYWDTSLDDYYEVTETSQEPAKNDEQAMDVDEDDKGVPRQRYKGRRIGNGVDMPELYREDACIAFMQGVAYAFSCSVTQPRMPPRLALQKNLFPVRQTAIVYRLPNDRQRARKGILEGPVMIIQARPEVSFQAVSEPVGQGQAEKLDLLREVAGVMLTAQERNRDGKTEKRPGQGQWWAEKPRWGGGPGGEVPKNEGNSDEPCADKKSKNNDNKNPVARPTKRSRWEMLNPPLELWDKRVTYERIGAVSADVDDVYMLSSLNHHLSIVRLQVPTAYIDCLTSGSRPATTTSPKLYRTRWYDFFDAADRCEAYRGLWAIFSYLMSQKK